MKNEMQTDKNAIYFGTESNEAIQEFLEKNYKQSKKIILTDDKVFGIWIENFITSIPALNDAEIIQIPEGEASKCMEIVVQVIETLSDYKISRADLLINFGGGMVSDIGGFIAAIYKRGIDFINIPTTLLSQVDASIGGKTGIDLGPLKNQIGVFTNAQKVFINSGYLSTLPHEAMLSGYAEMLKHGLIYSKRHWEELKKFNCTKTEGALPFIKDSVEIKQEIVRLDPLEQNIRKSLNFGHTIGHAIEGFLLVNEQPIQHGIAIAWGMYAEAFIAYKSNLLTKSEWEEISYIITDIYPPLNLDSSQQATLIKLMENDKKNKNGKIQFTLINTIGKGIIEQVVPRELILEALDEILN
ncbi:3-dehydroquinate synthase [Putridiphycobacter roseus]|uniref:3-dehydroquinate synthase n=1 Tax=Putridiphycobacter roseus TaxID=2219161 RepID=A0A2W1N4B2_9FLAO|nr:3-dehydroquinate synthase [Putridiphycobacter roseus]PZE18430.1 3-dehydroquinate synthase [Putridiphycobacter roseus]